jgi:hypothetical protein
MMTQQKSNGGTSGHAQSESHIVPLRHDDIASRAFEIYIGKGCQAGHCEENWLEAEAQLAVEACAGPGDHVSSHKDAADGFDRTAAALPELAARAVTGASADHRRASHANPATHSTTSPRR